MDNSYSGTVRTRLRPGIFNASGANFSGIKNVKNLEQEASSTLFSPKTLALQAIINRNFRNLAKLD